MPFLLNEKNPLPLKKKKLIHKPQIFYLYTVCLFFVFIIRITLVTQMKYNFSFSLKKMQSSQKKPHTSHRIFKPFSYSRQKIKTSSGA